VNDETPDEPGLPTGDPQVDAALSRLSDLDETDLDQHPEVFDAVQRVLGEVLASRAGEVSTDVPDDTGADDGAREV